MRILAFLFFALTGAAGYVLWLPDVAPLKKHNPTTTAYIERRKEQARLSGTPFVLRMQWRPWDQLSDHLKNAVLTAEDDTFYRHNGIDWDNVQIAATRDWQAKKLAAGGSTITQQVARN